MPSAEGAPLGPLVVREVRALWSRWYLWGALAALGLVHVAALHAAAPLEGAVPTLVLGLTAAWCCALPLVLACGVADDVGASSALLLQLGHGPARVVLTRLAAVLVGAAVLALPTLGAAGLLASRGAPVGVSAAAGALLFLAALALVALAVTLAAVLESSGWAALATLLGSLGALWLDGRLGAIDLLRAAREGTAPLATAGALVVSAATLWALAAVISSPVASGERRVVRASITLVVGGALAAAASRIPGELGAAAVLDVRARAAQATALGELRGAALVLGALFFVVGAVLAWRRRP